MCVVLPTGIRQSTKHMDRYLGTAQQCTEVSTLLWLQDLAHSRKIMYIKCSYTLMSETDVQC